MDGSSKDCFGEQVNAHFQGLEEQEAMFGAFNATNARVDRERGARRTMEAMMAVEGRLSEVEDRVDGGDAETRGPGDAEKAPFRGAKGDTAGRLESRPSSMGGTPIPLSKWREISGITAENERTMAPKERRAAIRKLKVVVEQEIREELKEAAEDLEFAGERTYLWDPVAGICHRLEIGPTVLSRLMKELTGMSASQMVDRIRAQGVREKLREKLRALVVEDWDKPGTLLNKVPSLKDWIKGVRREEDFSFSALARELGFASYTRFHRGCLLQYGKTPTQLEEEILREFEQWFDVSCDLCRRRDTERESWNKDPLRDPYRRPYSDRWTKALRERPEWVARMRAELEVDESVIELAGE